MLRADRRRLMLDTLRPPRAYRLDRAIGTTFTLDLETLLTAPLAFTFFDWEDEEGRPTADPLALIEGLRRHADRIHLFCQAGYTKVPSANQPLLTFVEDTVIAVRPPRKGGLFHPKVWILRFVPTAPQESVRYRVVCMSRNLTYSRSWDTSLVLDGELRVRHYAYSVNHPLGDFVQSLPRLAIRPTSDDVREAIDAVQYEIRRVAFDMPEGFEKVRFHALGIGARDDWPFPERPRRELLVLAPFVSDAFLRQLGQEHTLAHLVTRPESLSALPLDTLASVERLWAMSPQAALDTYEGVEDDATAPDEPRPDEDALTGLHAKLYVMDDGWLARVWTGSANATDSAFRRNVEFLVELVGRKSQCGIAALLGDGDRDEGLLALLQPYSPSNEEPETDDTERARLQQLLGTTVERLIEAQFRIDADTVDDERLDLHVTPTAPPQLSPEVDVLVWPVTLPIAAAVPLSSATSALTFRAVAISTVTAFVAFRVTAGSGVNVEQKQFVLRLELRGAPDDRRERVLQGLLSDADQVMRFLLLLLSDEGLGVHNVQATRHGTGAQVAFGGLGESTLLEALLHALHRRPEALDHIDAVLHSLQQTAEGRARLPHRLLEIWAPIDQARRDRRS